MATAATVFRDFETDGVPASGSHKVKKSDVRQLLGEYESTINAFLSNGGLIYSTKAAMDADLAHGANSSAWVVGDATVANNGIYRKIGASGVGSWTRVADLPFSFIIASDAGAGSANAIQATTSIPVSSSALIWMNVFEANTASPVTVSFNGGSALTIKTNSGNDVAVGGLTTGMIVMGVVSGSTFRLVSDQASAAVVAAAEAAKDAAEAAAVSVNIRNVSTRAALKALNTAVTTLAFFDGSHWDWTAGDFSTHVTTDTTEAVFVKADAIVSTVGAWVRRGVNKVDIRWCGATAWSAGSSPDSRSAIVAADTLAAFLGMSVYFPAKPFGASNGITRAARWEGEFAPQLAPFPLTGDDKQYLRPGYKHLLPGSSLIFTGTGTNNITTQRSDEFADITYCVRDAAAGLQMRKMAIVLNTDVYDAGGAFTAFGADNSAVYDVGHLIDDAAQTLTEDVVVWGYFPVAGTVIRTLLGSDDPDYNLFRGGSTMGRFGLALVGSETNDGFDSGLSGTMCFGMDLFSNDHHSRGPGTAATIYAGANTWSCIYIDGFTDAVSADVNGHYFYGGSVRTYANATIRLDCASQTKFFGSIFETPKWGVTNSDTTQFLATAETQDVGFSHCRFSDNSGLLAASFGGVMKGVLTIDGCPGTGYGGGMIKSRANGGTAHWQKFGEADGGSGDPAIQFGSGNTSSSTDGWSIRRDIDASDLLDFRWGGTSVFSVDTTGAIGRLALRQGSVTVASNAVTIGALSMYSVASGGAAATLTTINGGVTGQILVLRAAASGGVNVITVTEAGNIRLNAAGNFDLTNAQDRISLQYDGTNWVEMSRSDNTA